MPSAPANHDPALTNASAPNVPASSTENNAPALPGGEPSIDLSALQIVGGLGLDSTQLMTLLRHLPNAFQKALNKEDDTAAAAAHTLSDLSQAAFASQQQHGYQSQVNIQAGQQPPNATMISDPGPSSHPRGPPNLGQLSAVASASALQGAPISAARTQHQEVEEGVSDGDDAGNTSGAGAGAGMSGGENSNAPPNASTGTGGRTRGGRSATMGSDEWSRQRKDNHKEVERRRRGNINEGINELGRIVPNGSGEKAKGAILSRAVQYIHHLKENEARNIEKWTLEKLLMDQAMGDLQAQLEEMRRLWDEERMARQRAESELEVLRGVGHARGGNAYGSKEKTPEGAKRRESEGAADGEGENGREGKRQRVD